MLGANNMQELLLQFKESPMIGMVLMLGLILYIMVKDVVAPMVRKKTNRRRDEGSCSTEVHTALLSLTANVDRVALSLEKLSTDSYTSHRELSQAMTGVVQTTSRIEGGMH